MLSSGTDVGKKSLEKFMSRWFTIQWKVRLQKSGKDQMENSTRHATRYYRHQQCSPHGLGRFLCLCYPLILLSSSSQDCSMNRLRAATLCSIATILRTYTNRNGRTFVRKLTTKLVILMLAITVSVTCPLPKRNVQSATFCCLRSAKYLL